MDKNTVFPEVVTDSMELLHDFVSGEYKVRIKIDGKKYGFRVKDMNSILVEPGAEYPLMD